MVSIDDAIIQKENELEAFLVSLNNPSINQLTADLKSLRRSREILASLNNGHSPSQETNNVEQVIVDKDEIKEQNLTRFYTPLTVGDAVAELLKESNKPLPLSYLYDEVVKLGLTPSRKSFRALLTKDRRKRFAALDNGLFKLNDNAVKNPASSNGVGNNILASLGFSLKGAILELLPELKGEFSRPEVSNLLAERYPQVAPYIQKASVSTTLQVLVKEGLIRETYKGYGSDPKRYEVIKTLGEAMRHTSLMRV